MKKKTPGLKPQKSDFEKEQSFVRISTNILMTIVIIAAIVIASIDAFDKLKLNNDNTSSLTALSALSNKVDTSKLITNQLSDADKPTLIDKIKTANLDIITNDELDYNKYQQSSILLSNDLQLSSSEVGLIYSYIFVNNPDEYDVIFYELSITKSDDVISIKAITSINFHSLFPSNNESISSLPKRVYLTNITTIKNNEYTHSQVLFNNLNSSESKEISRLIEQVNSKINLNNYATSLIISFINNLALKTDTTLSFENDLLTFKKDASN